MTQKYISYEKALNKAMYLCSKAEKCKSDIQTKLYDWKANPAEHEKIIQFLEKQKFIDERRYVKYYVRDKFEFNKWGRIKIKTMLFRKKIPENIINEAIEKIPEEKYYQILTALISQKRKSLRESDFYKEKSKLLRFASSRGFEPDLILRMLEK
jgi:regulatory protein